MGRRADPDFIRAAKGKGARYRPGETVVFDPDRPLPPRYLNDEARQIWDYMAAQLEKVGILALVTRDALARYCQACADYEHIQTKLKAAGPKRFDCDEFNWRKLSHWQRVLSEADGVMRNFEREYALTPSSAAKTRRPTGRERATPGADLDKFLTE